MPKRYPGKEHGFIIEIINQETKESQVYTRCISEGISLRGDIAKLTYLDDPYEPYWKNEYIENMGNRDKMLEEARRSFEWIRSDMDNATPLKMINVGSWLFSFITKSVEGSPGEIIIQHYRDFTLKLWDVSIGPEEGPVRLDALIEEVNVRI